ncbi:MAG: serine/threonine protein kinase [Bacteroidales bacterium]|nr:serine/threonine protein kinase [Bacteroidales bacterium]
MSIERMKMLIQSACGDGTLSDADRKLLEKKASDFNISQDQLNKMIEAELNGALAGSSANDAQMEGSGFVTEAPSTPEPPKPQPQPQPAPAPTPEPEGSGFITEAPTQPAPAPAPTSSVSTASVSQSAFGQSMAVSSRFTDVKPMSTQGAMSTVYQGKQYGKWIIIKRIKPQFKDNEDYKNLFFKEFENAYHLDHPNIVRILDKGEDEEGAFYTMEYVDGQSLTDLIKTGRTVKDERLTKKLFSQMLDALSYVHKKQIIHRDLKPDNMIVTYRGDNVKILDFGLASADYFEDNLVKVGTPKYAAPEQMTKGNEVDQRADIYALGLILLEMTTGNLDDKNADTVKNPNFQEIIRKSTKQNRDERFYDCQEIMEVLNRPIAAAPVTPPVTQAASIPTPPKAEAPKPAPQPAPQPKKTEIVEEKKKSKAPLLIILLLLLVGLGVGAYFLFLKDKGGKTEADNNNNPPIENPTDNNQGNDNQGNNQNQEQNNNQQQQVTPTPEPNNGPSEEEIRRNEEQSALKEEYDKLMSEAQKVLDTKNVARALPLFEAIVKKTPAYAEAQNEAKEKVKFCKDEIAKTSLYSLKKDQKDGKIGYLNKDGYVVVDYLYKGELRHAKGGKILALKNESGKWGFIDDATKLPITEFKYTDTDNRHDFAGEYKMNVSGEPSRSDIIKADRIEEYRNGKKIQTTDILR